MDLYILIGNPRTRKSSVIRGLTGCFNRSVRDILPVGGKAAIRLYARVGALQDTRTRPQDFRVEVEAARCMAVLCCLAPSANPNHPGQFPDAQAYLARFKEEGWSIRSIVVLGQNGGDIRSPSLLQLPLASTAPINVTMQAVRAHFGWV